LGSKREVVNGSYLAFLFETRITHLGDSPPARVG